MDESLYEVLDLEPGASCVEIRSAYLEKARTAHPDKGGNVEAFRRVQEAYATLSNEDRRYVYDAMLKRSFVADPRTLQPTNFSLGAARRVACDLIQSYRSVADLVSFSPNYDQSFLANIALGLSKTTLGVGAGFALYTGRFALAVLPQALPTLVASLATPGLSLSGLALSLGSVALSAAMGQAVVLFAAQGGVFLCVLGAVSGLRTVGYVGTMGASAAASVARGAMALAYDSLASGVRALTGASPAAIDLRSETVAVDAEEPSLGEWEMLSKRGGTPPAAGELRSESVEVEGDPSLGEWEMLSKEGGL
mmetsp:Transcript_22635/g.63591  ORF Transcript_22635/g.63591 Transcript_22635/m.63591 type:complete len:308 (+) Transcript_22635:86-1009(+)